MDGKRLGEIVAGADAHGFDGGIDGGVGGHDNDDGVRMLSADPFEERDTAASGKFEVEEKDVDGTVLEDEACRGYGFGGLGGKAEVGGDLRAGAADGGVVVHDEDAELRYAVAIKIAAGEGG